MAKLILDQYSAMLYTYRALASIRAQFVALGLCQSALHTLHQQSQSEQHVPTDGTRSTHFILIRLMSLQPPLPWGTWGIGYSIWAYMEETLHLRQIRPAVLLL